VGRQMQHGAERLALGATPTRNTLRTLPDREVVDGVEAPGIGCLRDMNMPYWRVGRLSHSLRVSVYRHAPDMGL